LTLNNASLAYNTIGFTQIAKVLTVPSVVAFSYLLFGKTVSRNRLLAVAVACIGVAIATGASLNSNPSGAFIAVLAFCSTALYQVWIGKTMELEVSAPQLLLNQTPVSILILLPFAVILDTVPDLGKCHETLCKVSKLY